jgi:DNA-binding NarL/FixJ family response regulator
MSNTRLLLVDDHAMVRGGLRLLLEDIENVEVVAEAEDGATAINLAKTLRPDIVIMDIAMVGMSGLRATARIKEQCPQSRVMILTMHNTKQYVLEALKAGASAYILKDSAPFELELAVRALERGETYLSQAVSKKLIEHSLVREQPSSEPKLSPRQREILLLIAEGHSTKEIGHRLRISIKTVETHRLQLMLKLSINDIAGLVRYAVRVGIIAVPLD